MMLASAETRLPDQVGALSLRAHEEAPTVDLSLASDHTDESEGYKTDGTADHHEANNPIKCSAVHTLERDMPEFDYSHLVRELRARIVRHYEENPGLCARDDIDKCKTDDWHLSRFLLRQGLDVEAALDMLKRQLRFRNESLYNSIRPEDFPQEFYQVAGMFNYETDRKGNRVLYIRVKVHRKLPEIEAALHGFVLFQIQRADELAQGRGIAIVFDCSGAGLANADLDLLTLLITNLKEYFPKGLSYFLVHNLPWILKPIWMVAKQFISEDHAQLIKFSDAKTIFEYIDRDKLPDFMGGTCKRPYGTPPDNCTTLEEAVKLWGVERPVVGKVILRFKDYLPRETVDRAQSFLTEASEQDQADNEGRGL